MHCAPFLSQADDIQSTTSSQANDKIEKMHDCSAGSYYGKQYTETETPTIEHCAKLCQDTAGCQCFTYGTESGYKGTVSGKSYTSDGRRAKDCLSDVLSGGFNKV